MATVEQQVRDAVQRGKPGEALLILARAVDACRADTVPQDDWSLPSSPPADVLGERPEDEEEARVWDAKKRLAEDVGMGAPNVGIVGTGSTTIAAGPDSFTITVATAPDAVMLQRPKMASALGFYKGGGWTTKPELALAPVEAVDAYVKGGPLWLHAYDRDFVVGLPEHLRRALVQDLEQYAPNDAHLLARDILKDASADGLRGIHLGSRDA